MAPYCFSRQLGTTQFFGCLFLLRTEAEGEPAKTRTTLENKTRVAIPEHDLPREEERTHNEHSSLCLRPSCFLVISAMPIPLFNVCLDKPKTVRHLQQALFPRIARVPPALHTFPRADTPPKGITRVLPSYTQTHTHPA